MTSTLNTPLDMIETKAGLHDFIRDLQKETELAVDTESNSLYAYQERVCLIQFSYPGRDVLVDPLKIDDLSPLEDVFQSIGIRKLFHGSEYDLMCLKRDFDFHFQNIADTRVSCRTLGWKQTGLGSLLKQVFQVSVNKKYQRANWGARPLSEEMRFYARLDTHYLIPLEQHLQSELKEAGRVEEAAELCELLVNVKAHTNGFDPDGFWNIRHARDLNPAQMAVLRELYLMRDEQARRLDRPPFKIMHDKTLMSIAQARPRSLDDLEAIDDIPASIIRRHKSRILDAVLRGMNAKPPKKPARKPRDDVFHRHYENLHRWRKQRGRKRGVESDIILPREIMEDIAHAAPRTLDELRPLMAPLTWRFHTYGDEILQALRR